MFGSVIRVESVIETSSLRKEGRYEKETNLWLHRKILPKGCGHAGGFAGSGAVS